MKLELTFFLGKYLVAQMCLQELVIILIKKVGEIM